MNLNLTWSRRWRPIAVTLSSLKHQRADASHEGSFTTASFHAGPLGGLHELRRTHSDRDLSRDRSPSSSRSPTPTPSEGSPGDHPWAPRAASRSPGPAERVPRPAERPGRIPLKAARGANRARSPSEDSASPPPLPLVVTDEPEEPDAGSPAPAPAKKKGRKRSRPSRRKKGRYKKKQS